MKIYLDNASTTPLDKEVLKEMLPFLKENYGNASSIHSLGQASRQAVDKSRQRIADFLGCSALEIVFTGSATESDNLAIKGIAKEGDHIITTKIEHPAVWEVCSHLKGVDVTYLDVNQDGLVSVDDVKGAIKENTALVSIIYANNEIGTIQPILEISEFLKDKDILFHTDAVQALNYLNCKADDLKVDLLTLSAHKIYGPKGIGALYVRKGIKINPLMHGGHQENGIRPGTENIASIVGFGKAIELIQKDNSCFLRDKLIKGIIEKIPDCQLNGSKEKRLPNNVNFSFRGVEGESILMALNEEDIYCSTGSACSTGDLNPSHVLLALGLSEQEAHGSLRMTLGRFTKEKEIDKVLSVLPEIISNLRKVSGYEVLSR